MSTKVHIGLIPFPSQMDAAVSRTSSLIYIYFLGFIANGIRLF